MWQEMVSPHYPGFTLSIRLMDLPTLSELGFTEPLPKYLLAITPYTRLTLSRIERPLRVMVKNSDGTRYRTSERYKLDYGLLKCHLPPIHLNEFQLSLMGGAGIGNYILSSLDSVDYYLPNGDPLEEGLGYVLAWGTEISFSHFVAAVRYNYGSGDPDVVPSHSLGFQGSSCLDALIPPAAVVVFIFMAISNIDIDVPM